MFLVSQAFTVEHACWSSAADRFQGGKRNEDSSPLFVALLAAFAVSLTLVVSAVAAETPFKGTVNAVETGRIEFPTRFLVREGTGTATYLGRYTEHITMVINLPTLSSTGRQRSRRQTATP